MKAKKEINKKRIPLRDSRPPRCMISKWQGGASLVHLLWHFSLSQYKRAGHLLSVYLVHLVVVIILVYLHSNEIYAKWEH